MNSASTFFGIFSNSNARANEVWKSVANARVYNEYNFNNRDNGRTRACAKKSHAGMPGIRILYTAEIDSKSGKERTKDLCETMVTERFTEVRAF
jgi:hypothetical protein